MVLTISKAARADIIKFYNVDPTKVVVTYPGIVMNKNILTNKVLAKYGIKPNFILYVGTLQPRKNLVRLIEAFGLLENKTLQLVIVGKKGWLFEPILETIEKSPQKDNILVLD